MYARTHQLNPQVAPLLQATAAALDAGRADEAEHYLTQIRPIQPDHPEVLRMLAGLHSLRGRHGVAVRAMQQAVSMRPADPMYHNTMGMILGSAGDYDNAIDALQRACRLDRKLVIAWYNLGVMLTRCLRHEEAVAALRRVIALAPQHARARTMLAEMLHTQGKVAEARAEYRHILAGQPWAGTAWWGLADLKNTRFQPEDAGRMRHALQHPRASDDDKIAIGMALAKALDEAGEYGPSLQALAEAHQLARRRSRWDGARFTTAHQAIDTAFATAMPAPENANQGQELIFVVGLPRSGTTLAEQILASHSRVEGAGELTDLPLILNEESRRRGMPFPQWVATTTASDWNRLGRQYLDRTASWRSRRPVLVDKLPNNWEFIGAIRAMLPGAHIVICRRDPVETCLSAHRQHMVNNEYTRTFEDLGTYWRAFDHSATAWLQQAPEHVFTHDYERLLAAPEPSIRKLLAFCNLEFEPGCLHFHDTDRVVRSPSASQVRQPLRTDTARAERYGELLDPLRKALGRAG